MGDESLIPNQDAVVTPTEAGNGTEGGQEAVWQWNDELKGSGEAPVWFKGEKYKSVADQAAAYGELEKKFGAFTGAPDEYEVPSSEVFAKDIDLPEGVDFNLDADDPLLKSFSKASKEMGINQDGFNRLVGLYIQQQANDYAATMTNAAEEKARLGANADERLDNIGKWGAANMDKDLFGKFQNMLTSADAVEVVEHLVGKTRNSSLPNPAEVSAAPAFTKQDYDNAMGEKDEKGNLKYLTDPSHRAKVERIGKALFGGQPHRQIMG